MTNTPAWMGLICTIASHPGHFTSRIKVLLSIVDNAVEQREDQYGHKLGSHALPHPRTGARIEMRKLDRIRKRPYRDPMEPSGSFFFAGFLTSVFRAELNHPIFGRVG